MADKPAICAGLPMGMAEKLRAGVRKAYSDAGRHPRGEHPFPVGRVFAESLGYPRSMLDDLPALAVEAFAGVSNVSVSAPLAPAAAVLDLGCGAGLDSLIAARRVGPLGWVVGIDFSAAMIARASDAVGAAGARNIGLVEAAAERLPLSGGSINVALVNGIFNLNPARAAIFEELARVLVPGGVAYAAELILKEPLPPVAHPDEASWFA